MLFSLLSSEDHVNLIYQFDSYLLTTCFVAGCWLILMECAVQANYTISFDVSVVMGMFKTAISVISIYNDPLYCRYYCTKLKMQRILNYALSIGQSRRAYCFSSICIWPYTDRIKILFASCNVVCAVYRLCVEADKSCDVSKIDSYCRYLI